MGGKSKAPPAPDYTGAAEKTAAGNLEMARLNAMANRVDYSTPYGSLKYSQDPNNQDKWNATITLDPAQQALLDAQNQTSQGLANLQNTGLSRVQQMFGQGFDTSSLPQAGQALGGFQGADVYNPASNQLQNVYNPSQGYQPNAAMDPSKMGMPDVYSPEAANLQQYDPKASTNTATQALMSRIQPELDRQREALRSQLANQGITIGSEAYNNEMDRFGRQANDAATQAALQGINLGMQQSSLGFGQGLQSAQFGQGQQAQRFNQQLAAGQYGQGLNQQAYNQALQNAQFGQGQQAQQFGQGLQAAQFGQGQQAQQYGQQAQNLQQMLAAQNQRFSQSNQARQQAIQEQAYLRQLPLNELNALRSGAQVTNPTFSNVPQQAMTQGADYSGAAQNSYNAALNAANAQNAASGNFMSGLFGLGSSAIGAGLI